METNGISVIKLKFQLNSHVPQRGEMEELKQLKDDPVRNLRTASSENAAKTRQWLMDSVSQLRNEMDQINQKWNLSGIYQHSEQFQNQIHLIQVNRLESPSPDKDDDNRDSCQFLRK